MSLFKIEIFDRDFNFRSAAAVESPELMMDYLTLESTTIHLPRTDAKRGDWAHITDYNGKVVYQGIIKDVSAGSSSTALKIAPLLSLFDVQVQYDHRIFTQPLENCIRQIIIDTYIGNPDRLQNIPGLKIKQLTQTKGSSLDIRSDIHAFWDIITKGITMYDIIVDCVMDPQRKELMVTIGKRSGEVTLEADRDNCLGSNFVLTDDYGSLNKVTFKNKDNEDEVLTYYLHPDGKIDTKNENRIVPVFFSAEYIQGADNFESEAKSRAKEQLAPQKYQQIIELSFRENDRMIEPDTLDVGVTAMIHHNGKAYRSILTGWKSEGGIKTLMFGCLRLELTKKIDIGKETVRLMIDLKRFDDRVITPRDDALIFSFMTAGQCGIFDGLTVSHLGANQIKVSDGRGMVMGRDFIIGEETIAAELSTSGTVKGRLTIRIDLANEAVPIEFVTVAADTLPTPVQEEINHDGSVFELPLCEYDIDTTQISNLEMVAQILTPPGGSQTEIGSYLGDGAAARDIDLGYKPTIVFVFRQGDPFVFLSASSATNIYSGVVCELGASKGIYAIDNGFKVLQNGSDPPDGKRACLNESGKTYVYIAKK